jgi:hypothetical protein
MMSEKNEESGKTLRDKISRIVFGYHDRKKDEEREEKASP